MNYSFTRRADSRSAAAGIIKNLTRSGSMGSRLARWFATHRPENPPNPEPQHPVPGEDAQLINKLKARMAQNAGAQLQPHQKPSLTHAELTDTIDVILWAGQLLLQHGANSSRVEKTIHQMGTYLGCDWVDTFISFNGLTVSASSGGEFRTKVRRVVRIGVNMTIVSGISHLTHEVVRGHLNRRQTRAELERISGTPRHYNRWLVVLMVGLACAAFSRLFGGDWPVFAVTWGAASAAMFTRQELTKRHFNGLLVVTATAFVGSLLAGLATLFRLSPEPETALVATVLLLVPGVPLINSVDDLAEGYLVVGLARGAGGALISLGIALGLLLAMGLLGIDRL